MAFLPERTNLMGGSGREEEDVVLVACVVLPLIVMLEMRCISHYISAASPNGHIPLVTEFGAALLAIHR